MHFENRMDMNLGVQRVDWVEKYPFKMYVHLENQSVI